MGSLCWVPKHVAVHIFLIVGCIKIQQKPKHVVASFLPIQACCKVVTFLGLLAKICNA